VTMPFTSVDVREICHQWGLVENETRYAGVFGAALRTILTQQESWYQASLGRVGKKGRLHYPVNCFKSAVVAYIGWAALQHQRRRERGEPRNLAFYVYEVCEGIEGLQLLS